MVQGVALELLCRLLFTEGSNPSLSVPSLNRPILLTTPDQTTNKTNSNGDPYYIALVRLVRSFIDINSLFQIAATRKLELGRIQERI